MSNVQCPDCNVDLEIGYIPDLGDNTRVIQMVWNAGPPETVTLFGFKTGSVKPSDPDTKPIPIWAFRCPNCGLLRLHAIPKPEEPAEEIEQPE